MKALEEKKAAEALNQAYSTIQAGGNMGGPIGNNLMGGNMMGGNVMGFAPGGANGMNTMNGM